MDLKFKELRVFSMQLTLHLGSTLGCYIFSNMN